MIVRCPACGAQTSLDILIDDQAAADALRQALEFAPLGPRLVRYLALFRPVKSRLTWPRVNALLAELLPAIRSGQLARNGRTFQVPESAWAAALDDVVAARDAGRLQTPLKSHGYLYEIAISRAGWQSRPHPEPAANIGPSTVDRMTPVGSPSSATARAIARLQARKRPTDGEGAP